MKFDTQRTFSFPVLRDNSDDYDKESYFKLKIIPHDSQKDDEKVKVDISFDLSVKELKDLILKKTASYVVVFDCRNTFYRKAFVFNEENKSLEIPQKFCRDQISFENYLVSMEKIENFSCNKINEEFGKGPFTFEAGSVLCQGKPKKFYCMNDTYKSLTNLITASIDNKLKDGEWKFDIEQTQPRILVSENQYAIIGQCDYKSIFANVFLYPMVVEMLRAIRDDEFDSDYMWVQILEEKLEESSIDIKKEYKAEDLLYVCQKVLNLPLTNLNNDLKKIGKR